jgi:hypothetical protein
MSKKIIISFVLILILTFMLGLFLGIKLKSKTADNKENTYQAGWDAAKAQLEKSGIGTAPAAPDFTNLPVSTGQPGTTSAPSQSPVTDKENTSSASPSSKENSSTSKSSAPSSPLPPPPSAMPK